MSKVLVTGSNRGIGLALCQKARACGDEVVAVCRSASDALRECGARIIEGIDVTQPEDLQRMAGQLEDLSIDVLIANAGRLSSQRLGQVDAAGAALPW